MGGGASRFATDAFERGEAGAAVEVGRGVCVADAELMRSREISESVISSAVR